VAQASLRLLGGFRAQLSSGVAVTLPTRKAQALLASLALPPGRAHPRDKLAALLWGDVPQARARGALRQALFALRRGLPTDPPALRLEGDTVALDMAAVIVDVTTFEGHAAAGAPDDLARAVALYQGDLLAGLSVTEAAFEEWLAFERERLRELALETMARLLAHQRSAGTAEAAIRTALGLLALDPLQEPVHRTLMRLYTGLGRRGAAPRQYQVCVDALQRELGTAPEAATRRLYEEILRQSPAEAFAPAAPGGPAVEDLPRDTPLIGRGAELVRLRAAVDGAARGSGRVVAIVGEAGIGKSRLVAEVCAEASARGVRVLVGRAHEAEQILAFGVWAEILRGARPGDDPALLAALGAPWRAALASLLPEVAAPGSSSAEPTDYRRLFESVARVVEHLGGRQSLLVVIEDAHWADDMSVRLLAFLGRRLAASPVLLVVTAREEDLADAPALRRLLEDPAPDAPVTVALGRLARDETLALVSALSRAAGDAEALATRGETVWIASEGNPFMVVESVRALDASDGPPPRALLPERVRAVIQRRLDRLGGPARELAVVAAVIGRDVDFALLHRATGMDEASAASLLEELVRHRILHGVGERFDFTHDRIRETVYRGLLEPRRKLLHRAMAEAIEARHAGTLEPHHLALGLHYRVAECWAQAARYVRLAGQAAAGRGAHREAVACFEAALGALERLPTSAETRAEAIDLRFEARNSLFPLGDDERLFQHLQAAGREAHELGDQRRVAWASSYMSNYFWRSTKGQYSIRINDQWRICFEWPDGSVGPVNVEIVDYH
jgi:DNA-binding SARP family transcriptional activator/plasmid maintenance system killer protein